MTVGEKIKYIRILKNMTQKELGIKCGFPITSADVRIRQYESNKMVPKADKLIQIANALDVDLSALSNINITSVTDVIHICFELEETYGLAINKIDDTYVLSFNKDTSQNELLSAFSTWYDAKQKFSNKDNECENQYSLWKASYSH